MMAHLREQMASVLTEAARSGIAKLDKDSPLARELSTLDVDAVLKSDIHQICEAISFGEAVRVTSLIAAIKIGRPDQEHLKEEIKKIAKVIEGRIEKKQGRLKTPASCRDLLFDL